ncbi:glycosyltransferase [Jannaschia sp. CCS1]|uniref:glycosyltransferase n=1 Tax=Jannaschia sp. (strain CCS1) TaxID=290400 RepID=UPI000053B051|nr:glycosyltransferase [Jannaschia sp. CCS1]ABD57199.1 glycosyl transferase group 1 [Jannaschia sp. CCS1]
MRIVIDLQGAQGPNRNRGIGRYSLDLTSAIIRNRGEHDIHIVLSDLFPDAIMDLRAAFAPVLPSSNIHVWSAPGPTMSLDPGNKRRARHASAIRNTFIDSLEPDVVLISSFFDGFGDNSVAGINPNSKARTAVILYDLIPHIMPDLYLSQADQASWYSAKIDDLDQADLLLSISASAGRDAVERLERAPDTVVNIMGDANAMFRVVDLSAEEAGALRARFGIEDRFLMYTGGIDFRKNIDGLIGAFAQLNDIHLDSVQLVIVCHANEAAKDAITRTVRECELARDRVIVTGYVTDDELLHLYNICTAFVMPSLYEGFGLPALEAMRCGAPVIASNTSSLPEVLGREDALFDPADPASIAGKIDQVLSDAQFRQSLAEHGLAQSRTFSWDTSAQVAMSAMEALGARRGKAPAVSERRMSLAYVSPLPPQRSGISDYSAEILRSLVAHYDIDVVVDQPDVSDGWITSNLTVRSADWFKDNHTRYDRILYHFGNSHFHQHMFDLLRQTSGVIVLHDFFLSNVRAFCWPDTWPYAAWYSHGYSAISLAAASEAPDQLIQTVPANLDILQSACGTIVHSEFSKRLAIEHFGADAEAAIAAVVPLARTLNNVPSTPVSSLKEAIGVPPDAILLASFGMMTPLKLSDRILEAFLASELVKNPKVFLLFVGEDPKNDFSSGIRKMIQSSGLSDRIRITGWVGAEDYAAHLDATDIAIQLRTQSRGETSAAVLDGMVRGIPVVVNANGSMAELDPEAATIIPDNFDTDDLVTVIENLVANPGLRTSKGARSLDIARRLHDPDRCAALYHDAIETSYMGAKVQIADLLDTLDEIGYDKGDIVPLAKSLGATFPIQPRCKCLFVDVSTLAEFDAKTGIQRVVRGIFNALLSVSPPVWNILPVHRRKDGRYVIAHTLMADRFGLDIGAGLEQPIDIQKGDIFLRLDLDPECPMPALTEIQRMRRHGVKVFNVIYDLLPLTLSEYFPKGARKIFENWFETVQSGDGAICISRTVAEDVRRLIDRQNPDLSDHFQISHFRLGSDIERSQPTKGTPENVNRIRQIMASAPTFLIVGTLEPRKGVKQTLDAFEILWDQGVDLNLLIVGKQGWQTEDLIERLDKHVEKGNRLVWLNGISDEFLEEIYAESTCLVMASEGEGFGLPLIEAARHKLPIIARDLPVFREVATDYATYFEGSEPKHLSDAIERWIAAWKMGAHIGSDGIVAVDWETSARDLLQSLDIRCA